VNKKRETELESKLDGYLSLLQERLEKTKLARKSAKKIEDEIRKLRDSRSRSQTRRKSSI